MLGSVYAEHARERLHERFVVLRDIGVKGPAAPCEFEIIYADVSRRLEPLRLRRCDSGALALRFIENG